MTDRPGSSRPGSQPLAWLLERPLLRAAMVLAALAYLPAITAAPGRMPADSKLYLYLDPGRFFGDAGSTFDARQFAGWVPHQHVAYLWPATPWFWAFETLGAPDWVAHRLWIGTILLAAGLGVRWCARLLGLGPLAAFTAAVVYQLTLYVLPYVSRTSVMLLPWAGLGWIVAFTIRASRRRTWGDPAGVALVVLTVGAVNATALAMIVPGPVLWLVHAVWQRTISWSQAVLVAARVGLLSLGVSLWWITMLVVQARHGTDPLPYSESLADVSLTATSAETWRSLGYWLFYVRDPYAATTTESLRYLSSTVSIALSYLIPLLALAALAWTRWAHRRFALLLIGAGLVLAVGVHPISNRSPIMQLFAGSDDGGLALALRSSTRALPLTVLGVALAIALGVEASAGLRLPRLGWSAQTAIAGAIVMAAIANLPSLWTGAFVDPALAREEDPPAAWLAAAEALDQRGDQARVLQLPGAEFGAYRWGYTVDQPLPALTAKPIVTRDLLPLGSPGAMDLLYAFDDRAQDGVLETGSIAAVARLLGVDTIWLTNDIAFDRFRTARPEVVRDVVLDAAGLGRPEAFGELIVNRPDVPMTDERAVGDPRVGGPVPSVELVPVEDPRGVVRAADRTLVVAGSGDGLVDAAAAGLLADPSIAVRYAADVDDDALDGTPVGGVGLVVTDSNRDRERQWRSSQETTGFTETGGPASGVLRPDQSHAGLDVFETDDPMTQTIALQRGPVTATATSYGEPFALLPEQRPAAAIDGDPATAWVVGEHGDPIGETIRLEHAAPVAEMTLRQAGTSGDRRITRIDIVERAGSEVSSMTAELDERSWSPAGQTFPLDGAADGVIEITIQTVAGGTPFTGSAVAGVGFSEIDLGVGPSIEIVRPPRASLRASGPAEPLALVFTRLRTDPMDRWRADPEPHLVREFELPHARRLAIAATVRIDARAGDAALAELFGWPAVASTRLTGSVRHAGVAALDGDPTTTWITAFDEAFGATLTVAEVTTPIERIGVRQPIAGFSQVTALTLRSGGEERVVELTPDAAGASNVVVSPPLPAGEIEIVLSDVDEETTIDRRFGDPVGLPAAIGEFTIDGVQLADPVRAATARLDCVPLVDVDGRIVTATIVVDGDAWLDGGALDSAMCDAEPEMSAGTHLVRPAAELSPALQLDRLLLDDGVLAAVGSARQVPTALVTDSGRFERTVQVSDCRQGCWLVVGEGFNHAWEATGPSGSLGGPERVDGGFNGWWLDANEGTQEIVVRWTAQAPLTVAIVASLLVAIAAIVLIVRDRAPISALRVVEVGVSWGWNRDPLDRRRAVLLAVAWVGLAGALIGPRWAIWGALAGLAVVVTRRPRLPDLTALLSLIVVAAVVVVRERRSAPPPNGAWPAVFESVHGLGMFAVAAVLVAAVFAGDADDGRADP